MKDTERRLNTSDGRKRCHVIDYLSVTTVFPLKGTPVTKHNEASARHLAPQVGFHRFKSEGQMRNRIRTVCSVHKRCRVTV
ncbi:Uncharacterised protein [Raoultella ornithinolytica]|nr:Uncharacterised protein [Raoultella ornithinolytica]